MPWCLVATQSWASARQVVSETWTVPSGRCCFVDGHAQCRGDTSAVGDGHDAKRSEMCSGVGGSGPACPLGCQLNTLLPQQVGREYWLQRVLDNLYRRVLPNMLTVLSV